MENDVNQIIISNLKKRKEELLSDDKNSKIKTCLIVQGGGMRGSYSMGALEALEELGFSDSFDYILGSSAGAINGAYFLAKQTKIATKVYSDYIDNNKFINFFRVWKILDVKYLLSVLSNGITALNKENISNSKTELKFILLHYPDGKECTTSTKEKHSELMNLIEACATIPALSNEKIIIDGEKYIDGATVNPVPIKHALELGCTDIVIILTRSRSFRRRPLKFVYDFLSCTFFKDWPKKSKDNIFERFTEVNDLYNFIWSHEGDNKNYRTLIVAPKKDALAGVLSKSRKSILHNILEGRKDVLNIFR